jgi:deoxycytidylate deaminase
MIVLKEVKNMNAKMTEDNAKLQKPSEKLTEDNAKLQKQVNDHNAKLQKQVVELSEKMSRMCEMQTEVMMKVTQMMTEVKQLKQMIPGQQLVRKSIIIAGGYNGNAYINSVEIFSWAQKTWTLLNPMLTCRSRASAVTYQGEVIISGGYDGEKCTDTMETSSCDASAEWKISPVKLPQLCWGHAAVMYKDSLILSGGQRGTDFKISDKIYEISMVPPYSTKILTTMPEPRFDHTMELLEDKLFIIGGYSDPLNIHDTVMMFNLVTKEWKMMTPLPFEVDEMATVLWQNNVIVLGGRARLSRDTVVMYNLTTGESKYLPSMKHKRQGCAAIVTGDVLVVMGGKNDKSAEAFHFQEQVWEELPDMNEAREYASAVVKPN